MTAVPPTGPDRPARYPLLLRRLPPWFWLLSMLMFGAVPVLLLLVQGSLASAFLAVVGNLYAIGLGRSLLWKQLGRPQIPPASKPA